jgi:hypothetical protein
MKSTVTTNDVVCEGKVRLYRGIAVTELEAEDVILSIKKKGLAFTDKTTWIP